MTRLIDQPLAGAEFLAVDTETNGLAGDLCELTEVGAVLVGGGELHETFDSLVRTERPLSRGIQRFTGITQGMVDGAPPPEEVLPELAEMLAGRVFVAHNARFDLAVLRQAFEHAGLDWPSPPALCTVTLARRFAPLVRKRGLASLADSLGIEVEEVHRALPDALTCARVLCALFPRLCANAPTIGDAVELLRGRRRARKTEVHERIPPDQRPDLSTLPDDPGVYIFRDESGKPLYVGKSISLRTRARAHFCAPAGWTERAEIVDYRPTNSELGALVLENRLIKEWRPPGNRALKRTERYCYLRCRLDIPFPVFDVAAEPAPGHAVNIGPLGSRALAKELADQLTSLYRLRQCGRKLKLREHPSAYGQMGRCVSPCLGDLDPNAYRRQLDAALAHFEEPGAGERLIEEIDARMREASRASASSGPRRCCAARSGSAGCSNGSTASCARRTRRRASCWRSTRSRSASTRSGSFRGGSSTGARFPARASSPGAPRPRSHVRLVAPSSPWRRSTSCGSSRAGSRTTSRPRSSCPPPRRSPTCCASSPRLRRRRGRALRHALQVLERALQPRAHDPPARDGGEHGRAYASRLDREVALDERAALRVGEHEARRHARALAEDRDLAAIVEPLDEELVLGGPERALDDAPVAAPLPYVGALRLDNVRPPARMTVRVADQFPHLVTRRVDEGVLGARPDHGPPLSHGS